MDGFCLLVFIKFSVHFLPSNTCVSDNCHSKCFLMNKKFDAVCFGEILWDVLPTGSKPGGAPMNVAYHLQKLGLETALISRVGKDENGAGLLKLLHDNGLTTEFVQLDDVHQTGIVNATIHHHEISYSIIQPVAWDFIEWDQNLSDLVEQSNFFVFGSLAARNEISYQTLKQLIEVAHTKVVDINLRPPHFTQNLVEELLNCADIVKLNEHEADLITRWYHNMNGLENQVQFIQDKFSVPLLIVTKGGDGALVCKKGQFTTHKGFTVNVADTVGSGDAFLAAFLYKNASGEDVKNSLQFANAMGAFIASKQGACPGYDVDDVKRVMNQSLVG